MSLAIAIIGLITTLAGLWLKYGPSPKTAEERTRETLVSNRKAEEKFRNEKDTSDLGNLP